MNKVPITVSTLVAEDLKDAWNGYPKDCAETFSPVLNKLDFVRRYESGEFGNRSPTWNSIFEWDKENPGSVYEMEQKGILYHIRNRIAGGPTYYNVLPTKLIESWMALVESGVPKDSLYISEMAPTSKTLIQGEVHDTPKGISLFYSTETLPMREALKKRSRTAEGIEAITMLRYYMNPLSYDWLEVLLERYPGHVVEFSTYGVCWGTLPGYNSVTWEVRMY